MPYIQRNDQNQITGAFSQFQEGIAEEFMSAENYHQHQTNNLSAAPISRKSPGRIFLEQISVTPVWLKVYTCAKLSTEVQAGMTLLLLSLTAEFDVMFFIRSFRDMISEIQSNENLPNLTEEDISILRSCLEGNGFNSTLFLD